MDVHLTRIGYDLSPKFVNFFFMGIFINSRKFVLPIEWGESVGKTRAKCPKKAREITAKYKFIFLT